jgi:hypothetical protein
MVWMHFSKPAGVTITKGRLVVRYLVIVGRSAAGGGSALSPVERFGVRPRCAARSIRDRLDWLLGRHPQIGSGCAPDVIQSHLDPPVALPGPFNIVTSPDVPFTRIRWPVLMRLVADPVPVTAGKPYSRQTIAACDIMPPISVGNTDRASPSLPLLAVIGRHMGSGTGFFAD